ncbi:MAG: hypothetical protein ACM3PP_02265 [Candidatus Saccharibacteria bacterium]
MTISAVGAHAPKPVSGGDFETRSIDQQIKILEEKKEKIEQEIQKENLNPDKKAANDRNLKAMLLQQIEMQIQNLESRKISKDKPQEVASPGRQQPSDDLKNQLVDIYA